MIQHGASKGKARLMTVDRPERNDEPARPTVGPLAERVEKALREAAKRDEKVIEESERK